MFFSPKSCHLGSITARTRTRHRQRSSTFSPSLAATRRGREKNIFPINFSSDPNVSSPFSSLSRRRRTSDTTVQRFGNILSLIYSFKSGINDPERGRKKNDKKIAWRLVKNPQSAVRASAPCARAIPSFSYLALDGSRVCLLKWLLLKFNHFAPCRGLERHNLVLRADRGGGGGVIFSSLLNCITNICARVIPV